MHTAIDAAYSGYELIVPFDERLDAWEQENHPQNKGSSNENPLYRLPILERFGWWFQRLPTNLI
jgi:hypothetical protein